MPDRKYLTGDEIKRLFVHDLPIVDKMAFQIGIATGLRASEILNIKLVNISYLNRSIKVWDEKKDEYRIVAIGNELNDRILSYLINDYQPLNGIKNRNKLLFNFSPRTLNRKVVRAFAKLGIDAPKRWHTFRHTYIRLMLDKYRDGAIQYICLQTGDKPATILEYYAVPSFESRINIAQNLEDSLGLW